jgi:hypothetical protein
VPAWFGSFLLRGESSTVACEWAQLLLRLGRESDVYDLMEEAQVAFAEPASPSPRFLSDSDAGRNSLA